MKKIIDHIEYVREQPHHIRKKVAFGVAAFGSGLVGLVWLGVSLSTNAFAIQGSNFAMSADQGATVVPVVNSAGVPQNLAGAASAAVLAPAADAPAHIEIVDTTPKALAKPIEQTILPF